MYGDTAFRVLGPFGTFKAMEFLRLFRCAVRTAGSVNGGLALAIGADLCRGSRRSFLGFGSPERVKTVHSFNYHKNDKCHNNEINCRSDKCAVTENGSSNDGLIACEILISEQS